jgi:phosphoribosyl-AMP cyclohydrolase
MNTRTVLRPNFEKRNGLITLVAQDRTTKEVLMVAWTNEAGYLETLRTGEAVYFSTSRNKRWKKGEESGDTQKVHDILLDCDGDAVIYLITQLGSGACHTKARSCFYRNAITSDIILEAFKAGLVPKEILPLIEAEVNVDIVARKK